MPRHEHIYGFVTSFPKRVVGLTISAVLMPQWFKMKRNLFLSLGILAVIALPPASAVNTAFDPLKMRYLVDFVQWLALDPAVSLAVAIGSRRFSVSLRPAVIAVWSVTLAWSCYCGFAFAVISCRTINYC